MVRKIYYATCPPFRGVDATPSYSWRGNLWLDPILFCGRTRRRRSRAAPPKKPRGLPKNNKIRNVQANQARRRRRRTITLVRLKASSAQVEGSGTTSNESPERPWLPGLPVMVIVNVLLAAFCRSKNT